MGKVMYCITGWALLFCAMTLGQVAGHRVPNDPTEDFSFAHASTGLDDDHHQMTEAEIIAVMEDHLKGLPKAEMPKLARHLLVTCLKYSFDPAFVLSMIQTESGFRADV